MNKNRLGKLRRFFRILKSFKTNDGVKMEQPKHMLILVNGYTGRFDKFFPDFCSPLQPYWSERGDQFIEAAKTYFGDVDHVEFVSGDNHFYSTASMRQKLGFNFGLENQHRFQALRISILGHSMGCAYAEGLATALSELGRKLVNIVHLSAADARGIRISETTKHIPRLQLSLTQDYTLRISDMFTLPKRRFIKGLQRYGIVQFDMEKLHRKVKLKDRLKWNSHFDTKTFGYIFDFLKDLENIEFKPLDLNESQQQLSIYFCHNLSIFRQSNYFQLTQKQRSHFVFVKEGKQNYYGILNAENMNCNTSPKIIQRLFLCWKRLKY